MNSRIHAQESDGSLKIHIIMAESETMSFKECISLTLTYLGECNPAGHEFVDRYCEAMQFHLCGIACTKAAYSPP